jgi:hypothetical protein
VETVGGALVDDIAASVTRLTSENDMPISESLEAQTRREVASIVCPVCSHEKKSGGWFCNRCFWDLPKSYKKELESLTGLDFAVAYDEAKDWLRINRI